MLAPRTMFLVASLSVAALCTASESTRTYPLAGHGTLRLQVPDEWRDEVHVARADLPPTIAFGPKQGLRFEMLVTPIWPVAPHPSVTNEEIRQMVDAAAKHAQSRAVESQLAIKEVPGMSGNGYYFAATDSAPEPGGYAHMTQGAARVGDLTVTFTILTNSGQREVGRAALDVIATASHASP